jgi:hypothetical protein
MSNDVVLRQAMNVSGCPFGVLEVDSRSEPEFRQSDIGLLQSVANILDLQSNTAHLHTALDRLAYSRLERAIVG